MSPINKLEAILLQIYNSMKITSITLFLIFFNLTAYSQYGETTLSRVNSDAQYLLPYYFPSQIQKESKTIETQMQDWQNEAASTSLKCFNEPTLFNAKTRIEIIRFLHLSGHRPILVKIEKSDTSIFLTTKLLDREPDWLVRIYDNSRFIPPKIYPGNENNDSIRQSIIENNRRIDELEKEAAKNYKIDSIIYPSRYAEIALDTSILINEKIWDSLMIKLQNCNYWDIPPVISKQGLDGSYWFLESYVNNNYWFVFRWSPRDCFRCVCEYLLSKSNVGKIIIY